MKDIYAEITGRIIAKLESGTIPWHQPWNAVPMNYASGRPYRGINVWLLDSDYRSPYWLTYRQARGVNWIFPQPSGHEAADDNITSQNPRLNQRLINP